MELLRTSEAVAAAWRDRFRHLMVDEFQDTNRVQLELIERLRGPETRLFTVGDEHQSIYRFRNADLEVFRAERARAEDSPDHRRPAAARELPRPTRGARGRERARRRPCSSGFTPLTAGRDERRRGPRAELLLTFEEGRGKDHRKWKAEGIELEPPPSEGNWATVAQARALAERLRALVDAGEAEPGRDRRAAARIHARRRVRGGAAALRPRALRGRRPRATGPSSRSRTCCGCSPSSPTRSTTRCSSARSRARRARSAPTPCGCCRNATGHSRHVWPTIEAAFGEAGARSSWRTPRSSTRSRTPTPTGCAPSARRSPGSAPRLPVTPLDVLVERTMNAFSYDLALLAKPAGRRAHGERPQADAPRGRVRAQRGPRPARVPRPGGREHHGATSARDRRRCRPRTIPGSGS